MKYTGRAIITQIEFATQRENAIPESPVIMLMLANLVDETPASINKKLQDLAGGTHGDGRVTITIEREESNDS